MSKKEQLEYLEALNEILKSNSLVTAKEIAADVLGLDVDEYLMDDFDFEDDDEPEELEGFQSEW